MSRIFYPGCHNPHHFCCLLHSYSSLPLALSLATFFVSYRHWSFRCLLQLMPGSDSSQVPIYTRGTLVVSQEKHERKDVLGLKTDQGHLWKGLGMGIPSPRLCQFHSLASLLTWSLTNMPNTLRAPEQSVRNAMKPSLWAMRHVGQQPLQKQSAKGEKYPDGHDWEAHSRKSKENEKKSQKCEERERRSLLKLVEI